MSLSARRLDNAASRVITSKRVTMLMADRGVTSEDLAAKLRILESTLTNFREGFRSLPTEVLGAMAAELDTNVAFVLGLSEDARPTAVIQEAARLRDATRYETEPLH